MLVCSCVFAVFAGVVVPARGCVCVRLVRPFALLLILVMVVLAGCKVLLVLLVGCVWVFFPRCVASRSCVFCVVWVRFPACMAPDFKIIIVPHWIPPYQKSNTGAVSASSKNLGSATIGNFRKKISQYVKNYASMRA